MKLYRCVLQIKMKVNFENVCGSSKGTGSRGLEVKKGPYPPFIMPLVPFRVLTVQGAVTKLKAQLEDLVI